VFNRLFAEKASLDDTGHELPIVHDLDDISIIDHIPITLTDVSDQLALLNPSKAYGPDGVGPRLLKIVSSVIALPLLELLQASFRHRRVPATWKHANVVPIYNKIGSF